MAESMEKNAKVMAIEHLKRIERRRNILEREKAMRRAPIDLKQLSHLDFSKV